MLVFGDYTCIPIVGTITKQQFKIFNFSSCIQNYVQLSNLLPKGVDCSSDENFDMSYFDYIYNNDCAFMEFMTIITNLYSGENVYIIIDHVDIFDRIAESLAEIIKQRFGYLSYFVNESSDYDNINYITDSSSFSIPGLANFDLDRQKYVGLLYKSGLIKDDPGNYD